MKSSRESALSLESLFVFVGLCLLTTWLALPRLHAVQGAVLREDKNSGWSELFDGKTLSGWRITSFGGEGRVEVQDGRILLEFGNDLTGITWKEEFPKINYEVQLEAMRVEGGDFFCGMTFPVEDSYCSLILGGWGGTVVGLSSIDHLDASENTTTQYINFKENEWYLVRLRVSERKIEAWLDEDKIVDQDIAGRKISVRPEVELSKPFGIASWRTRAALRGIKLRRLEGVR